MKILWTIQAKKGVDEVIDYLEREWTEKEINNLEFRLNRLIKIIEKNPEIFPVSERFPSLRRGLVDKNNYIVYRINPEKELLEIIQFRGTKQKPL